MSPPRVDELAAYLEAAASAMPSRGRAALLRILDLPDSERAALIGELYQHPQWRPLAGHLIDLEQAGVWRKLLMADMRRAALESDHRD